MNEKFGAVCHQLLKTANRRQQNTDNVLLFVENCDINLEILHKHNPFERIRDPDNCDVRVIFLWSFLYCPHNYYNDNKTIALDRSSTETSCFRDVVFCLICAKRNILNSE